MHGRPDSRYNQEALSQVTVVRLANSDSVELRLTTPARLTFRGRVTSAGEASGRWRCTDARALTPEFALGVDGEWVLRRGGWRTDKLTWPAIAH